MKKKPLNVLLDSGAFTVWNKGGVIDIDEYIEFIKTNSNLFDWCINLDVIGNPEASYNNWKYIRKAGVNSIPVFHLGGDFKWLERYMKQTDYIGIGAIANLNTDQRVRGLKWVWKEHLTSSDGTPKLKVHGLGLTSLEIVTRFPWYSVDSAACVKAAAFGKIYMPRTGPTVDYLDPNLVLVSDQGDMTKSGTTNYFAMPPNVQAPYTQLIKDLGFEVGVATGRYLKPRRGKKGEDRNPKGPLFIGEYKESEEGHTTLTNSYKERYKFNLLMWERIIDALHNRDKGLHNGIRVYHVCSTATHLPPIQELCKDPKTLVSYAAMSSSLKKVLHKLRG